MTARLHKFSMAAQRSLLEFSHKPTPTSLQSLLKVNPNWIQQELPHRYMHLIKFLSMKPQKLGPVLNRYLKDVDILANVDLLASTGSGLDLTRLKLRNEKSLKLLKDLKVDEKTLERILTLNYGLEILLDEYIALVAKKENLVTRVDVAQVAQEAVDSVLKKASNKASNPEIQIINTSQSPITTLYIRSHLHYMIQELVQSAIDNAEAPIGTKLSLVIACGKEDISFRITEESIIEKPVTSRSYAMKRKEKQDKSPSVSLAKLIAKYWGGDIETIRSGNTYSSYMHLQVKDCMERIPPILETMPTDILSLLMRNEQKMAPVVVPSSSSDKI